MKNRSSILALVAVLCGFPFVGCGESPQPVDGPPAAPMQAAGVSGSVVLEGAHFDAPTGTLFVSVRPKGNPMPWLSRKYELTGPGSDMKEESGVRRVAFTLSPTDGVTFNASPGQTPSVECEISVKYKENADALSKTLTEAAADFQAGKNDYLLTLKLP